MEDVYLKELKNYSVSEIMNFREKYNSLIQQRCEEGIGSRTTAEKIAEKRSKIMSDVNNKKSKNERRELPPLLPLHLPENYKAEKGEHFNDLVPGKDVVFVFKLYPPFTYEPNVRTPKLKHNMEIVMLGHQTLNLLCDNILCGESYMEVGGDISDTPDIPVRTRLGEKYKSRMLYIGNTFYIDKSNPNNLDYSETIKKWGKSRDIKFGETLDMHKQTCLDLVARIGYPYVYQHLGGCEHILRIEYARLIKSKDCLESRLYPFYNHLSRNGPKLCMACNELPHWIVFDSARMISNPSFLCDNCFRSYHYIDGKKIGKFSAVRYWDSPAFSNIFDAVCEEQTLSGN